MALPARALFADHDHLIGIVVLVRRGAVDPIIGIDARSHSSVNNARRGVPAPCTPFRLFPLLARCSLHRRLLTEPPRAVEWLASAIRCTERFVSAGAGLDVATIVGHHSRWLWCRLLIVCAVCCGIGGWVPVRIGTCQCVPGRVTARRIGSALSRFRAEPARSVARLIGAIRSTERMISRGARVDVATHLRLRRRNRRRWRILRCGARRDRHIRFRWGHQARRNDRYADVRVWRSRRRQSS